MMKPYNYQPLQPKPSNLSDLSYRYYFLALLVFCAAVVLTSSIYEVSSGALQITLAVYVVGLVLHRLIQRARYLRSVEKFVQVNSLIPVTDESISNLTPPALNFSRASSVKAMNAYEFTLEGGNQAAVYDLAYTTGSGRSKRTNYYAVARCKLAVSYPHIFLDGRRNNVRSQYADGQKLSLEGDFDNYFNLYLPDREQVNILSIITPDVMQTLIDTGRPYDIEIKGNEVFVFAARPFYSRSALPHVLAFTSGLEAQLAHRGTTWQPTVAGKPLPDLRLGFWQTKLGRALGAVLVLGLIVAAQIAIVLITK